MSRRLALELAEGQAKVLLKSLLEREERLRKLCAISDDDDVIADAGNDLVEVGLLIDQVKRQGVLAFGDSLLNLSDEPI